MDFDLSNIWIEFSTFSFLLVVNVRLVSKSSSAQIFKLYLHWNYLEILLRMQILIQ